MFEFYRFLLIVFLHLEYESGIEHCKEIKKRGFERRLKNALELNRLYNSSEYEQLVNENIVLFNTQYDDVIEKKDTKIYIVDNRRFCSDDYFITIEDVVSL